MAPETERKAAESGGFHIAPAVLLATGLEAGEVGVWRWEVQSGKLTWSHNLEAIHRLPEGTFDGTFEAFTRDIHAEDQERVIAEIEAALESRDDYSVEYRLPPGPAGETRWIEARGRVIRDAGGKASAMTGICTDITDHKETEAELELRARQHEAVVHLGEQALRGADPQTIFQETVRLAVELVSGDFAEILELSQDRDTLDLRAGHGWSETADGQAAATSEPDSQAGFTLRSEKPVVFSDIARETRFRLSSRAAAHGVTSGASVTIGGSNGKPFGVLAIYCIRPRCISPTDVRFLQSLANVLGSAIRAARDHERSELLIGELRHRVGNLFSLVQALHRQTGQSAHDARDLEMKFGARLASLAGAHSMILEAGWQKTSLRSLLETTLAPYSDRVVYGGSDIKLPADAAFSFSMALHELATNASKYGALSSANGRLLIETGSAADALGRKLTLVWKEQDGPPPPELAESAGFGSKLIAQVVERQLGGKVTRSAEPDGLRVEIEFPV